MRLSEVRSSGRDFVVTAEDDVFRFRFNLRGGAFSTQGKAAKAGLSLARRSAQMFLDAEVVALAISAQVNRGKLGQAANTLDCRLSAMLHLAMIVPDSHAGFRTGSGALDDHYHQIAAELLEKWALAALQTVPITMKNGKANFLVEWGQNAVPQVFRASHSSFLDVVATNLNKGLNAPALIGRAEDWRERLRAKAMERATAHLTDFVPVMRPEPRIIRGDRAASLMNIIVPRIEAQIEQVADPEEREALRARIDRLANRVAIEAANKSQARIVEDVRLSVAVLEEQVEHRLPAKAPDSLMKGENGPDF